MDPLNPFGPFHPLNPLHLIGSAPEDPTAREEALERAQVVGEAIRAILERAGGYLLALLIALCAVGAARALFR